MDALVLYGVSDVKVFGTKVDSRTLQPNSAVRVQLYFRKTNLVVQEARTDKNGYYEFLVDQDENNYGIYEVRFYGSGAIPALAPDGDWETVELVNPIGVTGPSAVYRGDYDVAKLYYKTFDRRDVVLHEGSYYICTDTTTDPAGAFNLSNWESFGAEFTSIATGLLLTEEAIITKMLTMGGTGFGDWGIIKSIGVDPGNTLNWLDGDGYVLSPNIAAGVFRVGTANGTNLTAGIYWDGATLEIKASNFELTVDGKLWSNEGGFGGTSVLDSEINIDSAGLSVGTNTYIHNTSTLWVDPSIRETPITIPAIDAVGWTIVGSSSFFFQDGASMMSSDVAIPETLTSNLISTGITSETIVNFKITFANKPEWSYNSYIEILDSGDNILQAMIIPRHYEPLEFSVNISVPSIRIKFYALDYYVAGQYESAEFIVVGVEVSKWDPFVELSSQGLYAFNSPTSYIKIGSREFDFKGINMELEDLIIKGNLTVYGSTDTVDASHTHELDDILDGAIYNRVNVNSLTSNAVDLQKIAALSINNANLTLPQDLTVTGDLTVLGDNFVTEAETVLIKDNLLIINDGEIGPGVTLGLAGMEIDRGPSDTNYQFVFRETEGDFAIGEIGSLQSVATREDTPDSTGVPFWNSTDYKFDTSSLMTFDGDTLALTTPTLAPLQITSTALVTNLNVDLLDGQHASEFVPRGFLNGTFVESFDALVISDGAVIQLTLEQSGGGDLTMQFSDGLTTLDCTPQKTVTLTEGTASAPQENFVYILQSTKVLTVSTTAWPSTEHAKIGYFLVQTAAYVQTDGALINQNWNDHISGTNQMGHLAHMAERIRKDGAIWYDGCSPAGTDNYLTPTLGSVTVQIGSGTIYQMHPQIFATKDTAVNDDIHIVNDFTTPYYETQNLYDVLTDALGGTLTNKYFNIILWGVVNKTGAYSPVMVNMPSGTYNNVTDALADVNGYDTLSLPSPFIHESSTGFLIARITVRKVGGTWAVDSYVSLRGKNPSGVTGDAGAESPEAIVEFPDNLFKVYDNLDISKYFTFTLDSFTTGSAYNYIPPQGDGTLGLFTGLVGGQTLYGGTAVSDALYLRGTSSATVGSVYINDLGGDAYFGGNTTAEKAIVKTLELIAGGASEESTIMKHASLGLVVRATTGSSDDYSLLNPGGSYIYHVPTGTTDVKFTGHVRADGDNKHVSVGVSDDLRMYHNGNDSILENITGHLYISNTSASGVVRVMSENSYAWIKSALNTGMYFDAGGSFIFRDVDNSSATILSIDSSSGQLNLTGNIVGATSTAFAVTSGYVQLQSSAGSNMYFDAGDMFTFRDRDNSDATVMTVNSATGDITTVGHIDLPNTESIKFGGDSFIKFWATNTSIIIGKSAGGDLWGNVIIGHLAGGSNSNSWAQTAVGTWAGQDNTGQRCTAIGESAGKNNTGDYQTTIGEYSGFGNSGESQNAMGMSAGGDNTGINQLALGENAGYNNSGAYQIPIGYNAGINNTKDHVIGIGNEATHGNTGAYTIAIGHQAGKSNALANQFILQQTAINATPLIQGNFLTGDLYANGNLIRTVGNFRGTSEQVTILSTVDNFTLTNTPLGIEYLTVVLNGQLLRRTIDYTISTKVVTLTINRYDFEVDDDVYIEYYY